MDYATQSHLKALREALEFRLGELRAELHADEEVRQAGAQVDDAEVADRKDIAARRQDNSVLDAQEERDLEEARAIEDALTRLHEGRYGDCADCGEPIALQRLLVQPAALRCAACQSAHEHAQELAGKARRA